MEKAAFPLSRGGEKGSERKKGKGKAILVANKSPVHQKRKEKEGTEKRVTSSIQPHLSLIFFFSRGGLGFDLVNFFPLLLPLLVVLVLARVLGDDTARVIL